ncbi:MAG: hypothetical protein ACK5LJ_11525 [Paracoccus sp. (in: a-proteobacteria)]
MIKLTTAGRASVADILTQQLFHFAWGSGDSAWTASDLGDTDQTALTAEISRKLITVIGFAMPDSGGSIVIPVGTGSETYSRSVTPTPYLYLKASVLPAEDVGAEIRELGVFIKPTLANGVPAGQSYLLPADVSDAGQLLAYSRFEPMTKTSSTRHEFEFVLPILGA